MVDRVDVCGGQRLRRAKAVGGDLGEALDGRVGEAGKDGGQVIAHGDVGASLRAKWHENMPNTV